MEEIMALFEWINQGIRRFQWYDISLIKLSTAAFVLMVAKLYPVVLSLDWYVYFVISLVVAVVPLKKLFK